MIANEKKAAKKKKVRLIVANATLAYSHVFLFVFWWSIIAGFFYYGFIQEGNWSCYATQDKSI